MSDAIAPASSGPLYLEDFRVGLRFSSETYPLDADQIRAFARQFDPQPFHLDEATARASLFGGLVASGWHTAAITMRWPCRATVSVRPPGRGME